MLLQVIRDVWHLFEQEFRNLWKSAAKQGRGGELALDVMFGPKAPAGTETLQVGALRSLFYLLEAIVSCSCQTRCTVWLVIVTVHIP